MLILYIISSNLKKHYLYHIISINFPLYCNYIWCASYTGFMLMKRIRWNDISTTLLFSMADIAGFTSRNMNTWCALLWKVVGVAEIFTHIFQSQFTYRNNNRVTLQWRHNERGCVSNHQHHDCLLLSILFRRRSMKSSKICITGLCEGNSLVTGEFPAQRASDAENVSIWWRHHDRVRIWSAVPRRMG